MDVVSIRLSSLSCCSSRSVWSAALLRATPFSAIVMISWSSVLLSLAWVRLAAVDVALTETAIGSGVTGMLLLNAAARLARRRSSAWRRQAAFSLHDGVRHLQRSLSSSCGDSVSRGRARDAPPRRPGESGTSGTGQSGCRWPPLSPRARHSAREMVLLLALLGVWSLAPDSLWAGVAGTAGFPAMEREHFGFPSRNPCRRSGFMVASIWAGSARMSPAAPFRAEGLSRQCGSWSWSPASAQCRQSAKLDAADNGGRADIFLAIGLAGMSESREFSWPIPDLEAADRRWSSWPLPFDRSVLGMLAAGPPDEDAP